MKERHRQKNIIESYVAAYNAFDVEGMLSHIHHRVEFKNFSANEVNTFVKGIDQLCQFAAQSKPLFTFYRQNTSALSLDKKAHIIYLYYAGFSY